MVCQLNFGSVNVMPQKKTFQEFKHHMRLSAAENTADEDHICGEFKV